MSPVSNKSLHILFISVLQVGFADRATMYRCAGRALLKGTQLWMCGAVIQSSHNSPRLVVAQSVDPDEPQIADSQWLWHLFLANSNPVPYCLTSLLSDPRPKGTHHKSF